MRPVAKGRRPRGIVPCQERVIQSKAGFDFCICGWISRRPRALWLDCPGPVGAPGPCRRPRALWQSKPFVVFGSFLSFFARLGRRFLAPSRQEHSKAKQRKAQQSIEKPSSAKQSKAMHSKAVRSNVKYMHCKTIQSPEKQCKPKHCNVEQSEAKQSKAKQFKTTPSHAE